MPVSLWQWVEGGFFGPAAFLVSLGGVLLHGGVKAKAQSKVTIQKKSDQNGKFYTSYIAAMEGDTISLATPHASWQVNLV